MKFLYPNLIPYLILYFGTNSTSLPSTPGSSDFIYLDSIIERFKNVLNIYAELSCNTFFRLIYGIRDMIKVSKILRKHNDRIL